MGEAGRVIAGREGEVVVAENTRGMNRVRLAVAGASGRMGRRVVELAAADGRFELVCALTEASDPRLGKPVCAFSPEGSGAAVLEVRRSAACDVLIDFSSPTGTLAHLADCVRDGTAIVIGTTGHDAAALQEIEQAAKSIAVLRASNFSLGVNLLLSLVERAAAALGPEFDIEVVEAHHRRKVDAPSGTALSLVAAAARGRGVSREGLVVTEREGAAGPRPVGQIGVHAVRMGGVVGEHDVHFGGPGETLTLRHSALSRDTFASGALRAAAWIAGRPAGQYSMAEVLGLK
ncbi:MAG: 4-hydroxy-tetrahydrodipicolinate reductase [Phycisphaerae bacterium]|nr:4-hydroxy-tetrahydrodipicolinate reductase [Phycisphaerae bacterium]